MIDDYLPLDPPRLPPPPLLPRLPPLLNPPEERLGVYDGREFCVAGLETEGRDVGLETLGLSDVVGLLGLAAGLEGRFELGLLDAPGRTVVGRSAPLGRVAVGLLGLLDGLVADGLFPLFGLTASRVLVPLEVRYVSPFRVPVARLPIPQLLLALAVLPRLPDTRANTPSLLRVMEPPLEFMAFMLYGRVA